MKIPEIKPFEKKQEVGSKSHTKLLFVFYLAAHLPLLAFFDARFWDDWSLYKGNPEAVLDIFQQAGAPLFGDLHVALQHLGWWIYPALTFLAFFLVVIFTYKIAEKLDVGASVAFWIAAFVAVLPVNFARIAAIDLPYALMLSIFMFSWMLLVSLQGKNRFFFKIVILAGFGFSFQTGSLLVLYAAPLVTHLIQRWKISNGKDITVILQTFIGSVDLILLPIIYWAIKHFYLTPHGIFDGYNSPSINFAVLTKSLIPLLDFFRGEGILVSIGSIVAILTAIFVTPSSIIRKLPRFAEKSSRSHLILILVGFVISYLGSFPYVAVGKLPSYVDWTSTRHQLTLMIGLAITLYGVLAFCADNLKRRGISVRTYLPLFFVVLFVANWWATYAEFYVDHLRQRALINLIKERPDLSRGNFIFLDSSGLNAFKTNPGLGEYAAIHEEANYSHDALILDYKSLGKYDGWKAFIENYGKFFGVWSKTENVDSNIEPSLYILSSTSYIEGKILFAIKMFVFRVFYPNREEKALQNLLSIDGPFSPKSH